MFTVFLVFSGTVLYSQNPLRQLNNIRYYSYPSYTRVVLDLSKVVRVKEKLLPGKNKTRLYFDLKKCRFSRGYPPHKKNEITINAGNLTKIRIAVQRRKSIRVVFDFLKIGKYTSFI